MPQATENNKPGGEDAPNSKGQAKPLEGTQLDEALLEKVVSDDAPGEAAAVLREVRLPRKPDAQEAQYARLVFGAFDGRLLLLPQALRSSCSPSTDTFRPLTTAPCAPSAAMLKCA